MLLRILKVFFRIKWFCCGVSWILFLMNLIILSMIHPCVNNFWRTNNCLWRNIPSWMILLSRTNSINLFIRMFIYVSSSILAFPNLILRTRLLDCLRSFPILPSLLLQSFIFISSISFIGSWIWRVYYADDTQYSRSPTFGYQVVWLCQEVYPIIHHSFWWYFLHSLDYL